jgi:RHS repeat-associated protein
MNYSPIQQESFKFNLLPYGEDYIYQRNSSWAVPYTFSGKEKDLETGYSYFGARYYDSDLSIWLSVDPLADKYPSMSAYMYTAGNPVMLVDPDGMRIKGAGFFNNLFKSDNRILAEQFASKHPGSSVTRINNDVEKGYRVGWKEDEGFVIKDKERTTRLATFAFADFTSKKKKFSFSFGRWMIFGNSQKDGESTGENGSPKSTININEFSDWNKPNEEDKIGSKRPKMELVPLIYTGKDGQYGEGGKNYKNGDTIDEINVPIRDSIKALKTSKPGEGLYEIEKK